MVRILTALFLMLLVVSVTAQQSTRRDENGRLLQEHNPRVWNPIESYPATPPKPKREIIVAPGNSGYPVSIPGATRVPIFNPNSTSTLIGGGGGAYSPPPTSSNTTRQSSRSSTSSRGTTRRYYLESDVRDIAAYADSCKVAIAYGRDTGCARLVGRLEQIEERMNQRAYVSTRLSARNQRDLDSAWSAADTYRARLR
jgi:hypothetical protein